MSELINTHTGRASFRWQLLTTVSAFALLGAVCGASEARATDDGSDHQTVWIELGGQLSRLAEGQETFAPAFPNSPPRPSIFSPSQEFEKSPLYSIDEYGKISFQPDASNWVFSASVRYGHSVSSKDVRQQTNPKTIVIDASGGRRYAYYPTAAKFADTKAQSSERHFIVDFQAGRDVGLGMLGGSGGSSVVSLGVRFAQFGRNTNIALKSDPDWRFGYIMRYGHYLTYNGQRIPQVFGIYHTNAAAMQATRSFHGIGPSLSWNASAPFAGSPQGSELAFDWGLNATILFGRQRAHVHHQTTAQYRPANYPTFASNTKRRILVSQFNVPHTRARAVTVPNVGGFAGITFRRSIAKVSFGYRADFFFGAMDGGINAAKKENVGFYGPFASVSVGIGG